MNNKGMIIQLFPALKHYNTANLMTTLTIVLNIFIIYLAMQGNLKLALWIYPFVAVLDVFDGKVARWTNCSSEFGARLDSLCDAVSFSLMPAILAFYFGFNNPIALILVTINAVAGIWRLAYFDIVGLLKEGSKEFYIGTPTTRTAALFFIGLTGIGFFQEYIMIFFYLFFIVSPVLMLINLKIEKVGLFAKSLYVLMPVSMILYWLVW